jgi:chromate reductase
VIAVTAVTEDEYGLEDLCFRSRRCYKNLALISDVSTSRINPVIYVRRSLFEQGSGIRSPGSPAGSRRRGRDARARSREVGAQDQDEEVRAPEAAVRGGTEGKLHPVRILAISGSLRAASSNTALLKASSALAPQGVEVVVYGGLAGLPHFNPDLDDLDAGTAPPPVMDFRSRLQASDGVLISSPEYAHGVPGAMKNAIDWVVSSGEIYEKPVALLNASMGATHAYSSLMETLMTADADIVQEASVRVGLSTNRIGEADIVADPEVSGVLRSAVTALARAIEVRRTKLHEWD